MKYIALGILILLTANFLGCAEILSKDVDVTGTVDLSDNPASGNSGVAVSNGHLSTVTDQNGYFAIEGKIVAGDDFSIEFSKAGYVTESRSVVVEWSSDSHEPAIDLGTIVLVRAGS